MKVCSTQSAILMNYCALPKVTVLWGFSIKIWMILIGLFQGILSFAQTPEFLTEYQSFFPPYPIEQIAISADEAMIAISMNLTNGNALVELRDRKNTQLLASIHLLDQVIRHLAFNPRKRQLAISGSNHLALWNLEPFTASPTTPLPEERKIWEYSAQSAIAQINFSNIRERFRWIEGETLQEVSLRSPYSLQEIWSGDQVGSPLRSFTLNHNENLLALSNKGKRPLKLIDPSKKQVLPPLDYHLFPPVQFVFLPSGKILSLDQEQNLIWGNINQRIKIQRPALNSVPSNAQTVGFARIYQDKVLLLLTQVSASKIIAHIIDQKGNEFENLSIRSLGSIAVSSTGKYIVAANQKKATIYTTELHQQPKEYLQQLQEIGATQTARQYRNHLDQNNAPSPTSALPPLSALEILEDRLRVAQSTNDPQEIESVVNEILQLQPHHSKALVAKANLQSQEDNLLLTHAQKLLAGKSYQEAITLVIKISPQSNVYQEARQLIAEAEKYIQVDLRLQKAEQQIRIQNWQGATTFLQLALEQDPTNVKALAMLEKIEQTRKNFFILISAISLVVFALVSVGLFWWYRKYITQSENSPQSDKTHSTFTTKKTTPDSTAQKKPFAQAKFAQMNSAATEKQFWETFQKTKEILQLAQKKDIDNQHTNRLLDFEAEIKMMGLQGKKRTPNFKELIAKLLFLQQTIRSFKFSSNQRAYFNNGSRQQQKQHQTDSLDAKTPSSEKNYYEILEVSSQATTNEIKKAYHRKIKEYHPDRHRNTEFAWVKEQAEEMTRLLGTAYQVLMDENARRRYNQQQFQKPKTSVRRS